MDYIYLISSLPKIGTPEKNAEYNINKIKDTIYSLLEEEDRKQFAYLYLKNDNKNLLHILRKKENIPEDPYFTFHEPSYYTYQQLLDGIVDPSKLHGYMGIFLKKHYSIYEGVKSENTLLDLYLQEAIETCEGFLSDFFQFKRNVKNIITAMNCYKFNYSLVDNLIGKNKFNQELIKTNPKDLKLSKVYSFVADLSKLIDSGNLLELEKKIDDVFINYLNSINPPDPFSSDVIYIYFIRLMISQRWVLLNEENGLQELKRNLDWVVNTASNRLSYLGENSYDRR